ncbi:hypothetical protein HYH03_013682 [Edaphochlamys debaryana]|uniref:F-box domain-containing protein n=1 Tax=Edaphochlamys debaryana TaxID=47281 RepID=A0A835XMP1_9CHLO|nr:hypothetical protein HYH03_013682 [Edaphochlamys debaryana]|eukprot:KAG2487682.1 hypothetical protein HYH03_013682 [Edaphochlamys debaryana]
METPDLLMEGPTRRQSSSSGSSGGASHLPLELFGRIASFLPPNEVPGLRTLCKAAQAHFNRPLFRRFRLSQPCPHWAFTARWAGPGACRSLTLRQRRHLVSLTAASGDVANLALATASAGCVLTAEALQAAAAADHVGACAWLLAAGCPTDGALAAAARAGAARACAWLLSPPDPPPCAPPPHQHHPASVPGFPPTPAAAPAPIRIPNAAPASAHAPGSLARAQCAGAGAGRVGWEWEAVYAAARGGHVPGLLAELLARRPPDHRRALDPGELVPAAAEGCGLECLQRLLRGGEGAAAVGGVGRAAMGAEAGAGMEAALETRAQAGPGMGVEGQVGAAASEQQGAPEALRQAGREREWERERSWAALLAALPPLQPAALSEWEKGCVLAAAAGSCTPDYRSKLTWLTDTYGGPDWGLCEAAAARPDAAERLGWLEAGGHRPGPGALAAAAAAGNLAAVEVLLYGTVGGGGGGEGGGGGGEGPRRPEWGARTVEAAARRAAEGGHVGVLAALHRAAPGGVVPAAALPAAAAAGQAAALAWAAEASGLGPAVFDAAVLRAVAREASVGFLSWVAAAVAAGGGGGEAGAPARGPPWDGRVFAAAAAGGCEESLAWLVERGCPVTPDAYVAAGRNGDLATMRCLRRLGVPYDASGTTFVRCVLSDGEACPLPALAWLLEAGCPVDWDAALAAARRRRRDGQETLAWAARERWRRGMAEQAAQRRGWEGRRWEG